MRLGLSSQSCCALSREGIDCDLQAGSSGPPGERRYLLVRKMFSLVYLLALALLVGGNALYTFLATPAVFRAFDRALAGDVVSAMMPGYYAWNMVLWSAVFILGGLFWFKRGRGEGGAVGRLELALLVAGLASVLVVGLWLYPYMLEVRAQVPSFAAEAPVGPARALFRRLHGVSMGLNMVQLIASGGLLALFPGREG